MMKKIFDGTNFKNNVKNMIIGILANIVVFYNFILVGSWEA